MNVAAMRNFIIFCGIGNLLEDNGHSAKDLGFTAEEQAEVMKVIELLAPNNQLPPEFVMEAKQIFREALDSLLSTEVSVPATED